MTTTPTLYSSDEIEIALVPDREFTYDCILSGAIVGASLTQLAGEELIDEVRYRALPYACTICGGAHRPTQCPKMANAPIYLCPSCDDLTLSPSLCQACIETGEAVNWDIDDVEDEELDEEIPEDEATLASPA